MWTSTYAVILKESKSSVLQWKKVYFLIDLNCAICIVFSVGNKEGKPLKKVNFDIRNVMGPK